MSRGHQKGESAHYAFSNKFKLYVLTDLVKAFNIGLSTEDSCNELFQILHDSYLQSLFSLLQELNIFTHIFLTLVKFTA